MYKYKYKFDVDENIEYDNMQQFIDFVHIMLNHSFIFTSLNYSPAKLEMEFSAEKQMLSTRIPLIFNDFFPSSKLKDTTIVHTTY